MSVLRHRRALVLLTALFGLVLALSFAAPARAAQLLPEDFFGTAPVAAGSQMVVDADMLSVDHNAGTIIASGDVRLFYSGYSIAADRLVYHRATDTIELIGHVAVRDPQGQTYVAEEARLTGGFKEGFVRAIVYETADGSWISADEASFDAEAKMVFVNASYAPCGECIDDKGRNIGWRLRAARVERDGEARVYRFDETVLEILGTPVAWLPWFVVPEDREGLAIPRLSYSGENGVGLAIPLYWALDPNYSVTYTPTLFSRQGFLADLQMSHDSADLQYDVHGWAIYQMDPSAYAGETGDRAFRGAFQTFGNWQPNRNLNVGWSGTVFTDPGFLPDYGVGRDEGGFAVNEAYVTWLDANTYKDVRVQQFLDLGNISPAQQAEQGVALPRGRIEHVMPLDNGGEFRFGATLDNIYRGADQIELVGPGSYPHVFGFEGHKTHLSLEAGWTKPYILDPGLVLTPYLGLRADAANYDGASGDPSAPAARSLLSATPIAAIDVRLPMIGAGDGVTHFVEPIVQLVARGGGNAVPGITNDNAQSFVFEDTNLFSFNRFSGSDRQETGLRLAYGLHYNAQFGRGGWLDVLAGQTIQLAGSNSFAVPDPALPGPGSGLEEAAFSDFVIGATGSPGHGLTLGAKALIDPAPLSLNRAAIGARLNTRIADLTFDYSFIDAVPSIGIDDARHEVGGSVTAPLADYWSTTGALHYDVTAASVARASVGVDYDDGYLAYGISATRYGPTSVSRPDSTSIDFYIRLMPVTGFGAGLVFD